MKQDIDKIKAAIHAAKKFKPEGVYDHSLYATYLYCVRSHYRGRLHMSIWNKHHPRAATYEIGKWVGDPRSEGKLEFKTLEDQAKWIAYVKAYIERRQSWDSPSNDWRKLELNFDKAEVVIENEQPTMTAAV